MKILTLFDRKDKALHIGGVMRRFKKWNCKHSYKYYYTDNYGVDETEPISGVKVSKCEKCGKLNFKKTPNVFYNGV